MKNNGWPGYFMDAFRRLLLNKWARRVFLCILLCLPIIFLFWGYREVRHEFEDSLIREKRNRVDVVRVLLIERLKKFRAVGLSLASRPLLIERIKNNDWEGALDVLAGIEKTIPELSRIFLADTASMIRADVARLDNAIGTMRSDTDWYKGVSRNWEPYISEMFLRKSLPRRHVVNVVIPVQEDLSKIAPAADRSVRPVPVGILALQLEIGRFADIVSGIHIDDKSEVVHIIDQHGHLVFTSAASGVVAGTDLSSWSIVKNMLQGDDYLGFVWNERSKSKDLFLSRRILLTGWNVLMEVPRRSLDRELDKRLRPYSLFLVFALCLYFVLILVVVRTLNVLRRKNDDLQKLFDSAQVGLVLLDQRGIVRRTNRVMGAMFPRMSLSRSGERIGDVLCCANSVPRDHLCGAGPHCIDCQINVLIHKVLREKVLVKCEEIEKSIIIDGVMQTRWLAVNATPVRVGGEDQILFSFLDISGHKHSQESLRQAMLLAEEAKVIQENLVSDLFKEIEGRRQVEEELQKAQELAVQGEVWWRSLIQEVPAVIFVLNHDGSIRSVNRPWLGNSVDALTGRLLADFVDIEQGQLLSTMMKQVFVDKRSIMYESYGRSADGAQVWFENHAWPVEINGIVSGGVLLVFDVTERKILNDSLIEMSLAVDHSPLSIAITDRFGKIKYVNARFVETTGYCLDEVYGQVIRILRPGGGLEDPVYKDLWRLLGAGKDWRGEYLERSKAGLEHWEQVTIAPVMDKKGALSNLIVLKENVHEAKRVKQKLIESEKRFMDVLYASNDAILLIYGQKFIDCNDATARMLGYATREEFLMVHPSQLSPSVQPDGRASFDKAEEMMAVAYKHGFNRFEWIHRKADGTDFPVEVSLTPIVYCGKDMLYCVWRDITEQKRTQQELMENQVQMMSMLDEMKLYNVQLEEAQQKLVQQEKLAAIGYLAAGVAHEINNPLGYVHGNVSALGEYADAILKMWNIMESMRGAAEGGDLTVLRQTKEMFDASRDQFNMDYIVGDLSKLLNDTKEGLVRIRKIVDGLKSFARRDGGEMVMANVNHVIEGIINIAWNEMKYHAELVKDYGEIPLVSCNPQQLGQVFVNLLVNAVQAMPEKGTITIKTLLKESRVVVSISDTGSGMPPEVLSKIFDPFFTTKEPGKGTGLGLSISYDIVKKHGGLIDVQSEVGKGTIFMISLPVSSQDAG